MNGPILLAGIATIAVTEAIWHFYRWYYLSNKEKIRQTRKQSFFKVLFFSEESIGCRQHAITRRPCKLDNCSVAHLTTLMTLLNSAERTLDVCMYFLTYHDLTNAIISAHKRNVIVRIITDADRDIDSVSQTFAFRKEGIEVRVKRSTFLMHHKFVIIDKEILITGSTNWTMQAFFGNFDNIIVTNQEDLVHPFRNEFNSLWKRFEIPSLT